MVRPWERTPFDDESFGTVFLIVTLCFLDYPLEVLNEANRVLAPGGYILFDVRDICL